MLLLLFGTRRWAIIVAVSNRSMLNHFYKMSKMGFSRRFVYTTVFFVILCYFSYLIIAFVKVQRHKPINFEEQKVHVPQIVAMSLGNNIHNIYPRKHPVRIIDGIMINDELDLLEIRLEELFPVVDHFIILEAILTRQN